VPSDTLLVDHLRGDRRTPPGRGFTLIELLIVVAIIAILAAIAVPNFFVAQTRAKVSRVKSDLRTVGVAIEAYQVDHADVMPPRGYKSPLLNFNIWVQSSKSCCLGGQGRRLTSPIAYITSLPQDIFNLPAKAYAGWPGLEWVSFGYVYYGKGGIFGGPEFQQGQTGSHIQEVYPGKRYRWFIQATGPDRAYNAGPNPGAADNWHAVNGGLGGIYDPTNGTLSAGDMYFLETVGLVGGGGT